MASFKEKNAIIEDLSNAFIDENSKTYAKEYQAHLNAIQAKAIQQVAKGIRPTQQGLRKGLKITGINRNTRNAFILGAVALLIKNDRDVRLIRKLKPMANLMRLYSVKNPEQFALKVDKLVQRDLGVKVSINVKETKALKEVSTFMTDNKEEIQKLVKENTKALKEINKKITTNESKTIIKRRNALIKERIVIDGVKRPLTNKEIASRLRVEFKDDSARLQRILDTEVHRQNELVKEVVAKSQDFKFKTWHNVGSNVRKGHVEVDNKKIPINNKFKVWRYKSVKGNLVRNGFDMMSHPGDSTAHADNIIRCKCVLTFSN